MAETERTLTFGAERHLVGTLTESSISGAANCAVLLTNVGVMGRQGPYRTNVELARRFAALGVPSLRYDLSGLGDSARPTEPLPHAQQWIVDTRAAMDALEAALGPCRLVLIGVCAGADVAYLTAPLDPRLRGVVMFDPYLYPTRKARLIGLRNRLHSLGLLGTLRAAQRSIQRRLQALAAAGRARPGQPAPEPPLKYGRSTIAPLAQFAAAIDTMVRQGTRVLLLVSGGFPYDHNYREQTADNLRPFGLADKVEFDFLPQADHVLMNAIGRQAFFERCERFVQQVRSAPDRRTDA